MRLIQGKFEDAVGYCRKTLGMKEFFEFELTYVAAAEPFRELDRFLWESRHICTRYRNFYSGPAVVDVTEWNRHYPNEYFDAFMYFIKDRPDMEFTLTSAVPCSSAVIARLRDLFDLTEIDLTGGKNSRKCRVIGFAAAENAEGERNYV